MKIEIELTDTDAKLIKEAADHLGISVGEMTVMFLMNGAAATLARKFHEEKAGLH